MNTFAKIAAPVALVLAAFGAQASELAPGDVGTRAVVASTSQPLAIAGPASKSGEIAVGDVGFVPVVRGTATADAPTRTAVPVRSPMVIGA